MVYVIDVNGRPLMPIARHGRARRLLKKKKAKVVNRTPFTIQLLYSISAPKTQWITLGVDPGNSRLALSACSRQEELFAAEYQLRSDVSRLISAKKNFKRRRRCKKRYRKLRVQNRRRSFQYGWAPPSVRVRAEEIVQAVRHTCMLLPVSELRVELSEFDYVNVTPYLSGNEPAPNKMSLYNLRQYILWNSYYKCESCKGREEDRRLMVVGERPGDMVVLCRHCFDRVEAGRKRLPKPKKRICPGDILEFSSVRKYLRKIIYAEVPDIPIIEVYGYQTKLVREERQLPFTVLNNAYCIASPGGRQNRYAYLFKFVRRHNRMLHNATILKGGIRKKHQAPYIVKGFRLWDKVAYRGQECFIAGRRVSGYFLLKDINGNTVHTAANCKEMKLLEMPKGGICALRDREAVKNC